MRHIMTRPRWYRETETRPRQWSDSIKTRSRRSKNASRPSRDQDVRESRVFETTTLTIHTSNLLTYLLTAVYGQWFYFWKLPLPLSPVLFLFLLPWWPLLLLIGLWLPWLRCRLRQLSLSWKSIGRQRLTTSFTSSVNQRRVVFVQTQLVQRLFLKHNPLTILYSHHWLSKIWTVLTDFELRVIE